MPLGDLVLKPVLAFTAALIWSALMIAVIAGAVIMLALLLKMSPG